MIPNVNLILLNVMHIGDCYRDFPLRLSTVTTIVNYFVTLNITCHDVYYTTFFFAYSGSGSSQLQRCIV